MSQTGENNISPETTFLFDLDGTLADTVPDLIHALNTVLNEENQRSISIDEGRWWVAGGSTRLISEGFALPPSVSAKSPFRDRLLQHYLTGICVGTTLFEGIDDLLESLDSRRSPWGIVTNKPARFTIPLLKALGLASRAAVVVSGDTLSVAKPDPAPLLHACTVMNVSASNCIYVGDDERDIIAGASAGMSTIAVSWGYGKPEEIPNWCADHVVSSASDILSIHR
ncbi:MAG: HAD-IA family hydrolase [Proteobacteria bacterium]|nr:HAD-IA family hydrolase [Pseudomonadota bacterium]